MTIEDYRARAAQCDANAALAPSAALREGFIALAADWRALAVQSSYVEQAFPPFG